MGKVEKLRMLYGNSSIKHVWNDVYYRDVKENIEIFDNKHSLTIGKYSTFYGRFVIFKSASRLLDLSNWRMYKLIKLENKGDSLVCIVKVVYRIEVLIIDKENIIDRLEINNKKFDILHSHHSDEPYRFIISIDKNIIELDYSNDKLEIRNRWNLE